MSRHARRRQFVRWTAVSPAGKAVGPVLLGVGSRPAVAPTGHGGLAATPGRSDADGDTGGFGRSGGFGRADFGR